MGRHPCHGGSCDRPLWRALRGGTAEPLPGRVEGRRVRGACDVAHDLCASFQRSELGSERKGCTAPQNVHPAPEFGRIKFGFKWFASVPGFTSQGLSLSRLAIYHSEEGGLSVFAW